VSASCIYEGAVRHRRLDPPKAFTHRLALVYIDLDGLPGLLSGRLLSRRHGALRFRRRDYLGDPSVPLDEAVREAVASQAGTRPAGPIRLLTQLCSFGHCFNPVSFYYCMLPGGDQLQCVLAEVTNTPWGERHSYVVGEGLGASGLLGGEFDKQLHVSPFMSMDQRYRARASTPADTLSVHIESQRDGAKVFDATLSLTRRELTPASARRMTLRYPFATVRVLALIYARAVGLKLAGATVHPHPQAGGA
jgi:uncharacterized protein